MLIEWIDGAIQSRSFARVNGHVVAKLADLGDYRLERLRGDEAGFVGEFGLAILTSGS